MTILTYIYVGTNGDSGFTWFFPAPIDPVGAEFLLQKIKEGGDYIEPVEVIPDESDIAAEHAHIGIGGTEIPIGDDYQLIVAHN